MSKIKEVKKDQVWYNEDTGSLVYVEMELPTKEEREESYKEKIKEGYRLVGDVGINYELDCSYELIQTGDDYEVE